MGTYTEYMGFDNLVAAEIKADTAEAYTPDEVFKLAPAGEIKKSTDRDQNPRPYDNGTYFLIKSEGDDTVELVVPVLPLDIESKILGSEYNDKTGTMKNDGMPKTKFFALGYRLLCLDGTYRYVWRHKGSFTMGDEEAKSRQGTDSNNVTLTFTGITTIHKFKGSGKVSKDIVADERDGLLDYSKWFEQVVTPDNEESLIKTEAAAE